ncbi:hypothetical protein [Wolbachia endosymbiont of Ctenocephalides felis wCfeJ]|nr:hypothetical protein [Wolbachia endosymbiont of Ctenocephalides felis wCfeJ]
MSATKPYFHFYAKSKIRDFLCSSTQIDKPYFHFYAKSKIMYTIKMVCWN